MWRSRVELRVRRVIRKEIGKDLHLLREPKIVVLLAAELTHGNKCVDVLELPVEESRMTP